MAKSINRCKHEYHPLPVSDPEEEFPLYCPKCFNSVKWFNGVVMTFKQYNNYYDEFGNLIDPNNDPSINNKV